MASHNASEEEQAWLKVMEVATLYKVPLALKAALHLNVLDIIAQHAGPEGFLSAAQIAQHIPSPRHLPAATPDSLNRILRLLASHGLLTCADTNASTTTYGLTPSCSFLMQTSQRSPRPSLVPLLLHVLHPASLSPLYDLHQSILDGSVPFTRFHGMPYFAYTQHDAKFGHLFNRAMAGHSEGFMQTLLDTYDGFEKIKSLVDVGGGLGVSLSMIVAKHPHIRGINFDQEHVIAEAPSYFGVEHVGGDMFKEIPQADAIFLKWVLHDWADAHCLTILENCYKALPKEGRVIVVDAILPNQVQCELGARVRYQMDLGMLTLTDGGKERTKEELVNLTKASGFNTLKFVCDLRGLSVVELYKEPL